MVWSCSRACAVENGFAPWASSGRGDAMYEVGHTLAVRDVGLEQREG